MRPKKPFCKIYTPTLPRKRSCGVLGPMLYGLLTLGGCDGSPQAGETDAGGETVSDIIEEECELPQGLELVGDDIIMEGDMIVDSAENLERYCLGSRSFYSIGINPGAGDWKRWDEDEPIQYFIDPGLADPDRVTDAIEIWEEATDAVSFQRIWGPDLDGDYIRFKNHNDACLADVGRKGGEQFVRLSTIKSVDQVVGLSINYQDKVYAWYSDGMMSVGATDRLDASFAQKPYTLPPGYHPDDILEIAIAPNSRVFTWYKDKKFSVGNSTDLDAIQSPQPYNPPPLYENGWDPADDIADLPLPPEWRDGRNSDTVVSLADEGSSGSGLGISLPNNVRGGNDLTVGGATSRSGANNGQMTIRGIEFAPDGVLITWYFNGQGLVRVRGIPENLTSLGDLASVTMPGGESQDTVLAMGIANNDWVYTWFSSKQVSAGSSSTLELESRRLLYDFTLPTACSVSTVVHEIGHALGLKHEHTRCDRDDEVNVYYYNIVDDKKSNFDKNCFGTQDYGSYDRESIMHYSSEAFVVTPGVPNLLLHPTPGVPSDAVTIVSTAIAGNDKVYVWWSDGTVTSGTSTYLEQHRARYTFSLPEQLGEYEYTVDSIVGMAIAKSNDKVYTWYENNTVSVGTTDDLDKFVAPYPFVSPLPVETIVGIAIAQTEDRVYTWYNSGLPGGRKVTVGQSDNLSSISGAYTYTTTWTGDITGLGISSEDKVYTWFHTFMTRGISNDLDYYDPAPVPFMGRGIRPAFNTSLSDGDTAGIEAMY